MSTNNSPVSFEELHHLSLCKPNRILFKLYFNFSGAM